jgi:hypothetical protein
MEDSIVTTNFITGRKITTQSIKENKQHHLNIVENCIESTGGAKVVVIVKSTLFVFL